MSIRGSGKVKHGNVKFRASGGTQGEGIRDELAPFSLVYLLTYYSRSSLAARNNVGKVERKSNWLFRISGAGGSCSTLRDSSYVSFGEDDYSYLTNFVRTFRRFHAMQPRPYLSTGCNDSGKRRIPKHD
jgi:hypothetical protein